MLAACHRSDLIRSAVTHKWEFLTEWKPMNTALASSSLFLLSTFSCKIWRGHWPRSVVPDHALAGLLPTNAESSSGGQGPVHTWSISWHQSYIYIHIRLLHSMTERICTRLQICVKIRKARVRTELIRVFQQHMVNKIKFRLHSWPEIILSCLPLVCCGTVWPREPTSFPGRVSYEATKPG